MSKRATEALFAKLHLAVCEELLRRIQSGEAKPADLAVAVKFLKDNGIEAVMAAGSPIRKLVDNMPDFNDLDMSAYQ